MSYIRDAMQKAEMLRKSATTSAMQEIPSPSTKEPIRANKTILSILCLQFLWMFILGGYFLCVYSTRLQRILESHKR
jgi:hypothetical protein